MRKILHPTRWTEPKRITLPILLKWKLYQNFSDEILYNTVDIFS